MPFSKTFRDSSLVDADPHLAPAAKAEGVTKKKLENIWTAIPAAHRDGLIAHAKDPASDGAGLASWRAGFESVFAELTEAEAFAVIRVAVMLAGGAIEEDDGTVTDAKGEKV